VATLAGLRKAVIGIIQAIPAPGELASTAGGRRWLAHHGRASAKSTIRFAGLSGKALAWDAGRLSRPCAVGEHAAW
jgi:hypothetical protein